MKFTFKDITNSELYTSAKILFVTGPYNIFNNIAIDEIRNICKPPKQAPLDKSLLSDFGDTSSLENSSIELGTISVSNNIDIDTFMRVINLASMSGKWFTNINYTFMTKKQKDWLNNYMKAPSNNGRLVVYCNEFKDYRLLLRNKLILNSTSVHLIQLSFPYREALEVVTRSLFEQKGVRIEQRAIELFIMRMSNSYDDYEETIDKIVLESVPKETNSEEQDKDWKYTITYDDTLSAMKGIENFILDDFLERLLIPLKSDKTNGRNKIYKMLLALLEEMGPIQLVNKLKFKIEDYIEFRLAINSGIIPIKVRFSVPEAKSRLGEEHKLSKFSDYTFRRMAIIASKTSLKDWTYMKMMIANIQYKYEKASYEKALYSLVNRTVLNNSRLNNDIGVENILSLSEESIDNIPYREDKLLFAQKN